MRSGSRLVLLLVLLRSIAGELFSRPCFDVCRNRTEDAVEFRVCVDACRETMARNHREEFDFDGGDDEEEGDEGEEGNSVRWLTGDLLAQLTRQDDAVAGSNPEVAGDLPDPEDDGESPIGRGSAAGKRGDWMRQRGGGGGVEGVGGPERMSFVRIGKASEDSKKRLASFVRIGRNPSQFFQFSERPFVRIQTSDDDEEEGDEEVEDLDDGFYPASEGSGRGNAPSDPVLRVGESLRAEAGRRAKRQSSFVRIGKSNREDVYRRDLNERFAPNGFEPEKKADGSFAGIAAAADSPLERAVGYPVQVGRSSSSKRPSFVRIGKSQLDAGRRSEMLESPEMKRSSSFVRIGKSSNEPRKRPSFVRIGKSLLTEKRPSFVRIGKSLLTEKRPSFVRIGKSLLTEKRPSFVRIGKSLFTEKRPSFVRIGKSLSERKRPSFVRIGRSQFPDVAYNGADMKRAFSSTEDYNFYRNEDGKRQSFVRIGKADLLNDATRQRNPASYRQNRAIPNSPEATNPQRIPPTESVSGATTWVPTVLGQVLRQVRSD